MMSMQSFPQITSSGSRARYCFALSILFLSLSSCSGPDNSIFPLQEGIWWEYSVIRIIKGEPHEQKLVEATLAEIEINGEMLVPRKRPDGRVEYYQRTKDGVSKVNPEDGSKTLILSDPIEVGTKWQSDSKILFLEVTGAFEATYNRKIKDPITIDYEIVSVDETVKVAAGKFRNCVRVEGKGSLYGGGGSLKEFMAIDTINIETIDWYAPGVGLVKRERKEYTHPLEFENHYSEELQEIRKI